MGNVLKWYDHFWSFTDETTFNQSHSLDPCLVTRELTPSNDINFYNVDAKYPPYPTNRGWFHLYDDQVIESDPIDFTTGWLYLY